MNLKLVAHCVGVSDFVSVQLVNPDTAYFIFTYS